MVAAIPAVPSGERQQRTRDCTETVPGTRGITPQSHPERPRLPRKLIYVPGVPTRKDLAPQSPLPRMGMNLPKVVNPIIDALAQPLDAQHGVERIRIADAVLYRFPYRKLSHVIMDDFFAMRSFYLPPNSTVEVRWDVVREEAGWRRTVTIALMAPDGLGAYGPINTDAAAETPLGDLRVARILLSESLDASGHTLKEEAQLGLTFVDPTTGETVKIPTLAKAGRPTLESYADTTLYLFDMTKTVQEMWAQQSVHDLLVQVQGRYQRETGRELPVQSAANYLNFLQWTFQNGIRQAKDPHNASMLEQIHAVLTPLPASTN